MNMLHFDINKSHVNTIMLHVYIFYLAYSGESRGSKIKLLQTRTPPYPKPRVRGLYHIILSIFFFFKI